ncbi:MAG: Xaa-Pro peptidase family protein [Candidatus Aminicenantales bacterium]
MKQRLLNSCAVLILAVAVLLSSTLTAGTLLFDKAEYAARRAKFMERIPDGVAVILGAQPLTSYHYYYQNNDFFYLCGVEIPNAVLVIDGLQKETSLFFTATERSLRNEGLSTDILKDPVGVTGVDRVLTIEELETALAALAAKTKVFYTPFSPEELMRECSREKMRTLQRIMVDNPWDGRKTREMQFAARLQEKFPGLDVRDCSSFIWGLRVIKSPAEIEVLRRAARIGVKAISEVMKATRPGMYEYELSALYNFIAEKEGAQDLAYYMVISSGENHPYVHYYKHDRLLKDGDFIVMDIGPDVDYYDTDITISYPVNGKFTPRQKEIYEASLAVHEANISVYRPGLTSEEVVKEVEEILKKKGFDLSRDVFRRMRGGFGHYVGLAVHDVGGFPKVLEPGMVFANEPMDIFPEENLGVRVENTVLITETGCEVLSDGIPRTVKEIEKFMKKNGIPQVLKKAKLY